LPRKRSKFSPGNFILHLQRRKIRDEQTHALSGRRAAAGASGADADHFSVGETPPEPDAPFPGAYSLWETVRRALLGDSGSHGFIIKLRLYRSLCAAGVGGSLALGGAMRRLVSKSARRSRLAGVSGGAGLGAMMGIAILGGHGAVGSPDAWLASLGLLAIPATALVGAAAAAIAVYWWSVRGTEGQVSISGICLRDWR